MMRSTSLFKRQVVCGRMIPCQDFHVVQAAGHDAALNDLMDRHATGVFHFLCRMLNIEDDANDLAQETFARVFRARVRFRPEARFSTWLFTIAANLARNQIRWRDRHPNASLDAESDATDQPLRNTLPATGASPTEAALAAERAAAVRAAVLQLPDDLREGVVLCEWEEKRMAEAAAILGTTLKGIESRLYRARLSLRATLRKWS